MPRSTRKQLKRSAYAKTNPPAMGHVPSQSLTHSAESTPMTVPSALTEDTVLTTPTAEPVDSDVNKEVDSVAQQRKFDKYVERAEKMIEQLTERQSLSAQEFDKQIVALAGGGLALTITLAKDILDKGAVWVGVLFASWAAFLLALLANLLSHRISTRHYTLMIDRQQHYLDCAEDCQDVNEPLDEKLKKQIDYRTKWVEGLNLGALITCLAGIAFFIIFTFYNKYEPNDKSKHSTTITTSSIDSRAHQGPATDNDTGQSTSATPPKQVIKQPAPTK